jgi:tol-pal system protein YbgF
MKVLVGALAVFLTTPVSAVDFFSSEGDNRRSPQKPSLEQRVQLLERRINTISNIVLRLDALQQEMQQLRGDVEIQNHAVERMKQRQNDFYTDMDQRISRLSGGQPAAQPTPPGVVTPATGAAVNGQERQEMAPAASEPSWQSAPITPGVAKPPAAAMSPAPARPASVPVKPQPTLLPPVVRSGPAAGKAPGQLTTSSRVIVPPRSKPPAPQPQDAAGEKSNYQDAFNQLMDRKYDQAQSSFRAFLKQYPGSRLADNAQYWLAEANYVTRNFDSALVEFEKVVQNFPSSDKISDALLKIGYIQYEKKQWGVARDTMSALINRYPNTTASQLAKKRLEKMRGEGH